MLKDWKKVGNDQELAQSVKKNPTAKSKVEKKQQQNLDFINIDMSGWGMLNKHLRFF